MTAANAPRSFADTALARLIALAIVVGIGLIFFVYWADDLRNVLEDDAPAIPILADRAPIQRTNAALKSCLDQRVGEVDKMKAEGVINDEQYTSFRQRAEQLCQVQNPL